MHRLFPSLYNWYAIFYLQTNVTTSGSVSPAQTTICTLHEFDKGQKSENNQTLVNFETSVPFKKVKGLWCFYCCLGTNFIEHEYYLKHNKSSFTLPSNQFTVQSNSESGNYRLKHLANEKPFSNFTVTVITLTHRASIERT